MCGNPQPCDRSQVVRPPALSNAALFLRFLKFGALAWGGPVAQIAMLRRELVERERWVDPDRFNRVLAVYQALPGPEATELCCYFGMITRGRFGALLAGVGFLLPGLVLMLIASWLYLHVGLTSALVIAAFAGVQPAIAALIVNAVVQLSGKLLSSPWLVACAALTSWHLVCGRPFWVPVLGCAAAGVFRGRSATLTWLFLILMLGVTATPSIGPTPDAEQHRPTMSSGVSKVPATARPELATLAWSGVKAGLLTFGGAYSAVPFVRRDAVVSQLPDGPSPGWMSEQQFLDGLAISGVLPAPLVIFCTFVGFIGGGWVGSLLMTIGVFAPAFLITLIGHRVFERLVNDPRLHSGLDAVAASVVGVLGLTAIQTAIDIIHTPPQAGVFVVAWAVLALVRSRWTVPALIGAAAAAGVALGR